MQKIVNGKLVLLTVEEIAQREHDAIKAQNEKSLQSIQDEISMSKKYLLDTDWYYIRKLETGIHIPVNISIAREEARAKINLLK